MVPFVPTATATGAPPEGPHTACRSSVKPAGVCGLHTPAARRRIVFSPTANTSPDALPQTADSRLVVVALVGSSFDMLAAPYAQRSTAPAAPTSTRSWPVATRPTISLLSVVEA